MMILQILVDGYLCPMGDPHKCIYALGDCAQVHNQPYPCTAQVAERQGRYLAKAIEHDPGDPQLDGFAHKPWGMLAYVGGYRAIHDTPVDKSQGQ